MIKVETKASLLCTKYYSQVKPNIFNITIPFDDKKQKSVIGKIHPCFEEYWMPKFTSNTIMVKIPISSVYA